MKNRGVLAMVLATALTTGQLTANQATPVLAQPAPAADSAAEQPANPDAPTDKQPPAQDENPSDQGSSEKDKMIAKGVGIFAAVMVVIAGIVALIRKLGIRSPF
ncbi:MAG: hypothetical protein Q4D85_09935 [Corynebacterium sp.]|uniref:hypothetical protein n=1 Tax=Corynebacterium sp. TaxID=1720 RepID=UPI0026DB2B9A|nr:hypothetical protein [Corynebacterium sp.]MDO5099063.1 hypothetical protein [Corynebacterium sp.]